jgi:outer membrane protein assembly factor BamD
MGTRFRPQAGAAYARIVREYPLSQFVEDAKKRLTSMEMAIPEVDPVAYNRMKYELENREKPSLAGQAFGALKRGPDVSAAAKSGEPAMTPLRPTVPVSVPDPTATGAGFSGDVTATTVQDSTILDTQPDARGPRPAAGTPAGETPAGTEPAAGGTANDVTGVVGPTGAPVANDGAGGQTANTKENKKDNKKDKKKK